MTRILLLLALLLSYGPASGAQTASGSEAECERACALPQTAPPICDCVVIGVNASSDVDNPDPVAKEIIDAMRDTYARQVADVANYTVVQTTSVGGPPQVLYFEKLIIDEYPVFKMVNAAELANREAEARGDLTGNEIAGVFADLLGGVAGSDDASDDDAGSAEAPEVPAELRGLLGQVADTFREIEEHAVSETREDLADRLFWSSVFYERSRAPDPPIMVDLPVDGDTLRDVPAWALVIREEDLEDFDAGEVWGPEYASFKINRGSMVVGRPYNIAVPIHMTVHITNDVGETAVLTRYMTDYVHTRPAPFLPRQTRLSMQGLQDLAPTEMPGPLQDLIEVVEEIVRVLLNDGPPTQEQMVQLIDDAMTRYR